MVQEITNQTTEKKDEIIVKVEDLHKAYFLGKNAIPALRGVSFELKRGELVSIMGPSGCGKTTLLNIIGGIDRPDRGRVQFEGRELTTLSDNQLADLRLENISFVFQFYNLLPLLSAKENVEVPLVFNGVSKSKREKRAKELLELVGLKGREEHLPTELSGGEQQRVSICRAMANDPDLMICDEPTGDLDSNSAKVILRLLHDLNKRLGMTILMVTHDRRIALICDRMLKMLDGKIIDEEQTPGLTGSLLDEDIELVE
ncbi:MAG: ATP-binding cassette domain-containing protein [Candidatus Heimdallarchaeota archaeon]|nr:ATP-binding cassette domain-containing protein [Candidatus Heimdallarchaeota archaeon]